jgi:hypothetical protein
VFLSGDDLGTDSRGQQITDSTFYMMLNAAADTVLFHLPDQRWGKTWRLVFDTRQPEVPRLAPASLVSAVLPDVALENAIEGREGAAVLGDDFHAARSEYELIGRSLVLFERVS